MPRPLRMPGTDVVPRGARRDFLEEMWSYYRRAGRLPLEDVATRAATTSDYPGTASRETIRRVLGKGAVPTRWATTETMFRVFCDIAGIDPTENAYDEWDSPSRTQQMNDLWSAALDEDPHSPPPAPRDPWAEPPF